MAKTSGINVIDIGSSKISCLITLPSEDNSKINVIGVATTPSRGVRKGQIVNIEEAVTSITDCVEAAERMAGYGIDRAFVSVSGEHIQSQNSQGVVAVSQPEGEIAEEDILRVIEAARAISLPSAREIVHVLPKEFIVDTQRGIKDPVGMSGVRLETEAHLITGSSTAIKNISKCINEIGIEIAGIVYSGFASSYSVLTDTEKELGVILLDIGGGTTNISVFVEGACTFSSVIPVGAKKITDDLAIGLMVSLDSAEKVKHALSIPTKIGDKNSDEIDVNVLGIHEEIKNVSRKAIAEGIIRPRLNEIFALVDKTIRQANLKSDTPAGVVITGGGAMTIGATESCRRVMQLPVRLGRPSGLSGLVDELESPSYATSVGLVLYGYKQGAAHSGGSLLKMNNVFKKLPVSGISQKAVSFIKSFLP